jgi:hypothetical protein
MVIDVIDITDPLLIQTQTALERLERSKILTYRWMSNGLGQMVEDICRLLGTPSPPPRFKLGTPTPRTAAEMFKAYGGAFNKIDALRIWGHGDIAGQNISAGKDGSGVVAHRTGLSLVVVRREEAVLRRLAAYFMPSSRVELRGCAVGRGFDGIQFLQELAEIWKVKVYGALELQPGTGLDWYGPVYGVPPKGRGEPRLEGGPKI